MKQRFVIIAAVFFLFGGLSLSAQDFGEDDFGPSGPINTFDIKGGFITALDNEFSGDDFEGAVKEGLGANFGATFTFGISAYIGWGLGLDYSFVSTSIKSGSSTKTVTGKTLEESQAIFGHQIDAGAFLGLTIPVNPVQIFFAIGPAFSYFNETVKANSALGINSDTNLNYSGITGIARLGLAYHLDEKTGLVLEGLYRFGSVSDQSGQDYSSSHDAIALRAGFRFMMD